MTSLMTQESMEELRKYCNLEIGLCST